MDVGFYYLDEKRNWQWDKHSSQQSHLPMKAAVYQQPLLSQASHFARSEPCLRKLPARAGSVEMEQFNSLFPLVPKRSSFLGIPESCSTPKKQQACRNGNRSL